jgi:hypothetical protein
MWLDWALASDPGTGSGAHLGRPLGVGKLHAREISARESAAAFVFDHFASTAQYAPNAPLTADGCVRGRGDPPLMPDGVPAFDVARMSREIRGLLQFDKFGRNNPSMKTSPNVTDQFANRAIC